MSKTTIIYYTSNKEKPEFEQKIRNNLRIVAGNVPIISVSHKPIGLGINICIGEREACNHNLFRQIQIGAKLATTPFVSFAEADCLYPMGYFNFIPEGAILHQAYKCTNLYILSEWGKKEFSGFYRKEVGTFAQITGREHLIKEIDLVLKDRLFWDKKHEERPIELFRRRRWQTFDYKNPIVSIKTKHGMTRHTKTIEPPVDTIPYWGSANELRKELFP